MLLLLFHLGKARYALDTAAVLEIVPRVALDPVRAPPGVAGLLDYHEAPVPVLDLCEMVTGEPAQTRFSTRLILVKTAAFADPDAQLRIIGLLAERATGLLERQPAELVRTGFQMADTPYLGLVASDADGFIHIVSVEELLTGPVRAFFGSTEALLLS